MFAIFSGEARSEKRVALVIGNSAYQHAVPLANPKNDASDIAAKLKSLGFEVVSNQDLDLAGMRRTVREFLEKLDGADLALFFYAGHGVQVNGSNYMVPVDAQLSSYNDLDFEALPMDLVLSAMERSTKTNLIFLDACRDNPFAQNLSRSMGTRSSAVGRGLARLGSGVGSLIAFATQPGNVALDGGGRNSPFTAALLTHLGTPGQDITRDLVNVRRDVLAATAGKQVPWENSSLTGEVILMPRPTEGGETKTGEGSPLAPPDHALELAYWESIRDSNEKEAFESYLKQYPSGTFSALAKLRIKSIDKNRADGQQIATRDEGIHEADATKAGQQPNQRTPDGGASVVPPVADSLVAEIQNELARLGCFSGEKDGTWDYRSRQALQNFAERQGIALASMEPTSDVLKKLKNLQDPVCPFRASEPFDGLWVLTRRPTNSHCGWRSESTYIVISHGVVSAGKYEGQISRDGTFKITHKEASGRGLVKGRISGDNGTGKFQAARGQCSGAVELARSSWQ